MTNIEIINEAQLKWNKSQPHWNRWENLGERDHLLLVVAATREACANELDFNAQATSNGGDEYLAAALWQEAEEIRTRN